MIQESLAVRLRSRLAHFAFRILRPMTLGVRALILDADNRVFLVRHSYVPGWHLPGGGVEAGETLVSSLEREVREEANIEMAGPAQLLGVYFNNKSSRRDHVAIYVVRDYRLLGPRAADWEIVEARFFARDELPDDTSEATRARLAEALDGVAVSPFW